MGRLLVLGAGVSAFGRKVLGGVVKLLRGGAVNRVSSSPASVSISVNRNGTITGVTEDSVFPSHPWHRSFNTTVGDGYWVRFTRASGDATDFVGTLGSWLQLNASRSIGYDVPEPGGPSQGTYTIEIASDASGSPIVAASAVGGYTMYGESTG